MCSHCHDVFSSRFCAVLQVEKIMITCRLDRATARRFYVLKETQVQVLNHYCIVDDINAASNLMLMLMSSLENCNSVLTMEINMINTKSCKVVMQGFSLFYRTCWQTLSLLCSTVGTLH